MPEVARRNSPQSEKAVPVDHVKKEPLGFRLLYLYQDIDHSAAHDAARRYKACQDPEPEKDAKEDNVIDVPKKDLRRIVDVSRNCRHGFVLLLDNQHRKKDWGFSDYYLRSPLEGPVDFHHVFL